MQLFTEKMNISARIAALRHALNSSCHGLVICACVTPTYNKSMRVMATSKTSSFLHLKKNGHLFNSPLSLHSSFPCPSHKYAVHCWLAIYFSLKPISENHRRFYGPLLIVTFKERTLFLFFCIASQQNILWISLKALQIYNHSVV